MTTTASITLKLREPGFGVPQPEDITHIAITRIPAYGKKPEVFAEVTDRNEGTYWSNTVGQSGNYWTFTAELPDVFDGLDQWDESTQTGDFVVNAYRLHPEYGYLPA